LRQLDRPLRLDAQGLEGQQHRIVRAQLEKPRLAEGPIERDRLPEIPERPALGEPDLPRDLIRHGHHDRRLGAHSHSVFRCARELGLDREVPTDWFLQDIKP
jgi:hypothetical protein